jgi:hypothetical protein
MDKYFRFSSGRKSYPPWLNLSATKSGAWQRCYVHFLRKAFAYLSAAQTQ